VSFGALSRTWPISRLIHGCRRRIQRLAGTRHQARGFRRASLYALASAGFLTTARGLSDRARLMMVLSQLIVAELAGREHGRLRPVAVSYKGERLTVYVNRLNDLDVLWEVFGERQYDEFELADRPHTVLDLGAHIGAALLALHVRFPDARLAAVEADPATFRRLERNLPSDVEVSVLHAAVSDRDEIVEFLPSRDAWVSGLSQMTQSLMGTVPGEPVAVRGVCFATLMAELGLDRVDLLKVDIEGAEWALVNTLDEERVGTLIMEWHADMHGHAVEELPDLLPGHEVVAKATGEPGRYFVTARPI
jgi:FkbM family methyltransferase